MSHFTCYVVVDKKHFEDVEKSEMPDIAVDLASDMLAPFNEQDENYCIFMDETEELYKEYTGQEILGWDKKPEVKTIPVVVNKKTGDMECTEYANNPIVDLLKNNKALFDENYEIKRVIPNEYFKTFDDFVDDWHGMDKEDGKYGYYSNPNAKWDWFLVGGRWTGSFLSKDVVDDSQVGRPGLMTDPAPAGRVDVIRKGDINIEQMKAEQREKAKKDWIKFKEYNIDLESAISWSSLLENRGDKTIEELRAEYESQPDYPEIERYKKEQQVFFSCPIEVFCNGDYEKYIYKAEFSAISSFAMLKDGKWFEKGEMGWFGVFSNEDKDWEKNWLKAFDSIDDDDWIVNVDCHI